MKPCLVLSELNYKGNITFTDYIKECKRMFRELVFEKSFTIMGTQVKIVYDDDFNKCFHKILSGDPKYHNNTDRFDKDRLEKIKWIGDLLSNYSKCYKGKLCKDKIISLYTHNGNKSLALYCETYNYGLFFLDNTGTSDPCYLLVTAYTPDSKYTIEKILNNKI